VIDKVVVVEDAVVAHVSSVEVEENIVLTEEVLTEEVVTPSIVATPPVETVQKVIEDQKTIEKVEEKKEAVEWVLPAKLKVDE